MASTPLSDLDVLVAGTGLACVGMVKLLPVHGICIFLDRVDIAM
jgi:hypothetical protein